jgi:cell division septum initiation protein DivIVA
MAEIISTLATQLRASTQDLDVHLRASLESMRSTVPRQIIDTLEKAFAESISRRIGAQRGLKDGEAGLRSVFKPDEIKKLQETFGKLIDEYSGKMLSEATKSGSSQAEALTIIVDKSLKLDEKQHLLDKDYKDVYAELLELKQEHSMLQQRCAMLQEEIKSSENVMDLLRAQIKRRNEALEEQRHRFHEEFVKVRDLVFGDANLTELGLEQLLDTINDPKYALDKKSTAAEPSKQMTLEDELAALGIEMPRNETDKVWADKLRKFKQEWGTERRMLLQEKKMLGEAKDTKIRRLMQEIEELRQLLNEHASRAGPATHSFSMGTD